MSIKTGDAVRTLLSSGGILAGDVGEVLYQFNLATQSICASFMVKFDKINAVCYEKDLELIGKTQFQVGDYVRISDVKNPYFTMKGTVISINNNVYMVDFSTLFGPLYFKSDEIELVSSAASAAVYSTSLSNINNNFTAPNSGSYSLTLGHSDKTVYSTSPSLHSCTWKTYIGLSYKEEYCDCGQTKNKRGIYE